MRDSSGELTTVCSETKWLTKKTLTVTFEKPEGSGVKSKDELMKQQAYKLITSEQHVMRQRNRSGKSVYNQGCE